MLIQKHQKHRHKMKYLLPLLFGLIFLINIQNVFAKSTTFVDLWRPLPEPKPWAILFYGAQTVDGSLANIVETLTEGGKLDRAHENIFSIELARNIYKNTWFKMEFAVNFTGRFANSNYYPEATPISEFDTFLMGHYTLFPWNRFIITTIGIGEGISYATDIPYGERQTDQNSQRFLDYMMFEATLALPSHPEIQLVARIHHRSGAYGVFATQDHHAGSNSIGFGIRYYF